ncbi:MAG: ribonuclease Z [Tunicatimonas sp.]
MAFQLKILGANSATPAFGRHPTSQLLTVENFHCLIDCGEGCQMQLIRYRTKPSKITHIFISHLHGDHFYGLIGLLNTFSLSGRTDALSIFGPPGLADVIRVQLRQSHTVLKYPTHFTPLEADVSACIYDGPSLRVSTLPMDHRIPCSGFLFRESPKPRRIDKEKLSDDLSVDDFKALKAGEDLYHADGTLRHRNEDLTLPPRRSRSYAYCADTRYQASLADAVREVDLLYHEATFMHAEAELAAARYHSTTVQAATLAKEARVGQLLIGHYSSRYRDLNPLLTEAQAVFPRTQLALEGHDYPVAD